MNARARLRNGASQGAVALAPLLYLYVEFVRPGDVVSVLSLFRLGALAILFSVFVWFAKCEKWPLKDLAIKLYVVFIVQMAIMTPIAVNNYSAFYSAYILLTYLLAFTLPAMALIDTHERVLHFFRHWTVINFILMLVTISYGGTGPGGFIGDENDVALAINMGLPYAFYLANQKDIGVLRRWWYWMVFVVGVTAVILTFSRGGFVGLFAVTIALLWFSRRKIRNLLLIVLASFLCGSLVMSVLPSGYSQRIESMFDPSDGTRSERLYSWTLGWNMFLDNPVLGVGPGNYPWRVGAYQPPPEERPPGQPPVDGRMAHSLYATLLPEMGALGTGLMLAIIWVLVKRMLAIIKAASAVKDSEQLPHDASAFALLAKAVLVSLFAYLTSGAFISVLYYPHFWIWIGFCGIIHYGSRRVAFFNPGSALSGAEAAPTKATVPRWKRGLAGRRAAGAG